VGGGRTFHGGANLSAPVRSFRSTSYPATGQNRAATSVFRSPGFQTSRATGTSQTGTNIRKVSPGARRQNTVAAAPTRQTSPSIQSPAGRQGMAGSSTRNDAMGQQTGLNGRTDHIAERHGSDWHRDWDHRRAYYENNRWYAFNGSDWIGLDAGYYPWNYYPYYTYNYYPYDYYVSAPDNVPPDYQGTTAAAPAPDATVQTVQVELTQLGYYNGPVDGLFGPTTRDALASYQTSKGLTVTGSLSPDTLQSLGLPSQFATS
jgi:hypothetical protein